ncbi:hypothetical protein [Mycoplasma capricolum]|uniref:hypothetical protein n=1 Tax=Mycoplasma capricolum TaxID=2095 RepID=UPI0022F3DB2C|nr:hypothetical protein [Mycoplasma capricolum]WBX35860.1 hypothetical protein NO343_02785 [Mycoplasma capricolum subsp. capricolum]
METKLLFGHKTHIKKPNAYFLLGICIVFIIAISASLLVSYSYLVREIKILVDSNTSLNQTELDKMISTKRSNFFKYYLFRYILNAITVIIFALYCVFAINRITVGYVFVGLWLIVWFGSAFGELILYKTLSTISIINLVLFSLVLISFYFIVKDISENKRQLRYQKTKKRQYSF